MQLDLDDPNAVLLAALDALGRVGIDALAYGGLALALYGEPRETRDADLAVAAPCGTSALHAMTGAGLDVLLTFEGVRFGGLTIDRLTLVGGGVLNTVDLVTPRSHRFAAAMTARALTGTLRGQEIRIATPEDFILMKVLSTRERDLEDARTIVAAHAGDLDRALLDFECALLATEIPDHDVARRYAAVVSSP